jgi:hypothetical protein
VLRELVQIFYFKSKMRQVWADDDRSALVKFADLNFFVAARRFQKNKLRAAPRSVTPNLLQPQNIPVERNRFFPNRVRGSACAVIFLPCRILLAERIDSNGSLWTKPLKRLHCGSCGAPGGDWR